MYQPHKCAQWSADLHQEGRLGIDQGFHVNPLKPFSVIFVTVRQTDKQTDKMTDRQTK